MSQKKMFHLFREAEERGSFDEYPMIPGDADPQLHLSRNDRAQPFFLICDGDTVVTQLSGKGRLEFHASSVRHFPLVPGDVIYVPAGTPSRYVAEEESIVVRTKAMFPKLEGVAWYCDKCDGQLHRHVWDAYAQFCQEGYLAGCNDFNADATLRTCSSCGHMHDPVDIGWNRWAEIVEELRSDDVATAPGERTVIDTFLAEPA